MVCWNPLLEKIPFSPNESQDLSIYNLFYLLDDTPLESSGSHVVSIIDNATVDTLVNAVLHTCRELPLVSVPRNTCTKLQVCQFLDNFLIFCIFTCNAWLGQILTFFGQMDEHIMIFLFILINLRYFIFLLNIYGFFCIYVTYPVNSLLYVFVCVHVSVCVSPSIASWHEFCMCFKT